MTNLNLTKETGIIVQGITGKHGSFHTKFMKEYGSNIVAGVTPGKQGQEVEGIPVYNSVADALKNHKAQWSIIFVPARFAKAAAIEAIGANLNIVMITEGIPVHDSMDILNKAKEKNLVVLGPNCPGFIRPDHCKIGIMPGHIFKSGNVGVVSRSGTLTYEIINQMTAKGIGQSTVVGIGGDPLIGTDFIDALKFFQDDPNTEKIVLIGEIGGDAEERAAEFIKENISKPVIAYIVGRTAPEGKKMGHAGAIISGSSGSAKSKINKLREAKVKVAKLPSGVIELLGIC
ncbi:succinate--CoA ligase subunit alpha [Candidatus Woesearchaeota archaeon]|jgi:succinyl-CoA synthetase alpha subunit|nr:succinate--CoA ligase subunit alpha [Candidatus Woesearchaeota archaeon]MBT6518827.1 succinate--CoA ligase subunit alpha [Candidatus Woesearchaeota archaeon]MBT7367966.1 succinate--CoA ligase subunit alpha [Candidatus Woesearchaeota archaeon]